MTSYLVPFRSYRKLLFRFWTKTTTLCFWAPFESLGTTYTVHLRLIEKLVVDFLFVLIELFSLGVTAEALRAYIDWKSSFLKSVGQFLPNFHVKGTSPPTIFACIDIGQWMPYNCVADSIHTKKLSSWLFEWWKTVILRFWAPSPFRGLRQRVRFIGERVVNLLLVITELFR